MATKTKIVTIVCGPEWQDEPTEEGWHWVRDSKRVVKVRMVAKVSYRDEWVWWCQGGGGGGPLGKRKVAPCTGRPSE